MSQWNVRQVVTSRHEPSPPPKKKKVYIKSCFTSARHEILSKSKLTHALGGKHVATPPQLRRLSGNKSVDHAVSGVNANCVDELRN